MGWGVVEGSVFLRKLGSCDAAVGLAEVVIQSFQDGNVRSIKLGEVDNPLKRLLKFLEDIRRCYKGLGLSSGVGLPYR